MGGEVFLFALLFLVGLFAPSENALPPRLPKEQKKSIVEISRPQEKELYIGAIFPINGTGGWLGGQGCLPAALMALDDVNAEPNLLPGYKMMMPYFDSECNPGLGASVMYDLLYNPPKKLMLLGGCSIVCSTIAEAAKMWNLVVEDSFDCFLKFTVESELLHTPTPRPRIETGNR